MVFIVSFMHGCVRPSLLLFPGYLWYVLMEFSKSFASSVSLNKDGLFGVKGQGHSITKCAKHYSIGCSAISLVCIDGCSPSWWMLRELSAMALSSYQYK